jgi:hypothetical protein
VLPPYCIPTNIRRLEHAAHPLRTPILEQPNAGQRSARAFPRSFSMQRPRCVRYLGNRRPPAPRTPLEQRGAGQRGTRAPPRPSSMSSRGPGCAPYLRNTHKHAVIPTPRARRPPTPNSILDSQPAEHQSVSTPIFNVIPRAEMCSLPKDYPQLRRKSDPKSTPPTHSARPLLEQPDAGQRSAKAFPRPSLMPSRGPKCAPTLGVPTTTLRIRRQDHAAHLLRTPPLEQPDAGQRGTRAFPRHLQCHPVGRDVLAT